MRNLVLVTALLLPTAALAQPTGGPPAPPPATPPEAPTSPPPPPPAPAPIAVAAPAPPPMVMPPAAPSLLPASEAGVLEDANSGRTFFAPTALMSPKGSWSFSDWELFFIGGSYSPTDNLSLSGLTLIPLYSGQPFVGLFTGKARLIRQPRVHVAVQGSLTVVTDGDEGDSFTAGSVGGVATYCTSPDCASHVSAFLGTGLLYEDQGSAPVMFAGSIVQKIGRRLKGVVEVDTGAVLGEVDALANGALLWYGLRFTSANIGVDLGLVKLLYEGSSDDEFLPLGFPWISFQYRGLPSD